MYCCVVVSADERTTTTEEDDNKIIKAVAEFKSVKLVWAHYGGKVRDLPKCDKGITVNQVHISLVYYYPG